MSKTNGNKQRMLNYYKELDSSFIWFCMITYHSLQRSEDFMKNTITKMRYQRYDEPS
jgi:hypothetical protein